MYRSLLPESQRHPRRRRYIDIDIRSFKFNFPDNNDTIRVIFHNNHLRILEYSGGRMHRSPLPQSQRRHTNTDTDINFPTSHNTIRCTNLLCLSLSGNPGGGTTSASTLQTTPPSPSCTDLLCLSLGLGGSPSSTTTSPTSSIPLSTGRPTATTTGCTGLLCAGACLLNCGREGVVASTLATVRR
ncbi:hypothetical protein XPA_005566 [Xanthoria parietina]